MRRMKEHDTLAKRLGIILTRLNTGEKLHLEELSHEFAVSERTLQRDFNERLNYLPIKRNGACYYLDPKVLGRQSNNEVALLLMNMGLDSLFSGKHYLSHGVLNNQRTPPFLFKNPRIENISKNTLVFEKLIEAVQRQRIISYDYHDLNYNEIHPYRLVNDKGIWLLACTYQGRPESHRVADIRELTSYQDNYKPDPFIQESIINQGLDRFGVSAVEVVVQIDGDVALNFLDEKPLPSQRTLKELGDGSVLVSCYASSTNKLLPILKAWIPYIEVLSPDSLRHELVRDLHASLERL